MNKVALDTNIAIDILNGKRETVDSLGKYDLLFLPVTVCGELLFGARNSSKREENLRKFREFIKQSKILPITGDVAEQYAEIRWRLKHEGKPIPENDIWIAATASSIEATLLTTDNDFVHLDPVFCKVILIEANK